MRAAKTASSNFAINCGRDLRHPSLALWIVAILLGVSSALICQATEKQPPPGKGTVPRQQALDIRWVQANGKVADIIWPAQGRWIWATSKDNATVFSTLTYRVAIQIPSEVVVGKATGEGIFPSSVQVQRGNWLLFSLAGQVGHLSVRYKDVKGRNHEVSAILRITSELPRILRHSSCAEQGVHLKPVHEGDSFLALSAFCLEEKDGLGVYVAHSGDAIHEKASLDEQDRRSEAKSWVHYVFPRSKLMDREKSVSLKRFRVGRGLAKGQVSEFDIAYSANEASREKASRFSFSPGFGVTYLGYSELHTGIRIGELGATLKAGLGIRVIPGVFDLGLGGYVNVYQAELSASSAGLPAARFYGLNLRFGYQLPFGWKSTALVVNAGGYLWGMMVNGDQYGIKSLKAPQIFVLLRRFSEGSRPFSVYLKFAPLFDQKLVLGNRELALGSSLQLSAPGTRFPLSLTLDLSDTRFTSQELAGAGFSLSTASLGTSVGF